MANRKIDVKITPNAKVNSTSKTRNFLSTRRSDISKAIKESIVTGKYGKPYENNRDISPASFQHVVADTSQNIADSDNLLAMLPDLRLAMGIKVASMLSPNDLITLELNYRSDATILGEANTLLLEIVRKYFIETYKIKSQLSTMLRKSMFLEGSYPQVILPETSVNDFINSNLRPNKEDINIPNLTGFLGESSIHFSTEDNTEVNLRRDRPYGLESLGVSYSDNVDILKTALLNNANVERSLINSCTTNTISHETYNKRDNYTVEEKEFIDSLYRPRTHSNGGMVAELTTQENIDRPTVGHPLVLKLPPESVMPVGLPAEPEKHVGYYIALDENKSPLRVRSNRNYMSEIYNSKFSVDNHLSRQLAQLRVARFGQNTNLNSKMRIEEMQSLYTKVVEEDMVNRLRNGTYGSNVAISNPTEVLRIMFARACHQLDTHLLFVPEALMSYLAFNYNEFGVGISLIDDTKILASQRAMISFANTMASVKNSIPRKKINITLPETERDPHKAIGILLDNYIWSTNAQFPLAVTEPVELVSYMQRSAHQVKVSGNPNYPETDFDVSDESSSAQQPDTDLEDNRRRQHLQGMGIPPEIIEQTGSTDFAAQVYAQNALFAKQNIEDQQVFNYHITDFHAKYIVNSQILMDSLSEVISKNREMIDDRCSRFTDRQIALYFIGKLRVSLPEPTITKLSQQMEAFQEYSNALDEVIPAFVSTDLFTSDELGDIGDKIDTLIAIVKSRYQRRWMSDNNVMPELFDLLPIDDTEGFDLLEEHSTYLESIDRALMKFITEVIPRMTKSNKTIEAVQEYAEENTEVSIDGEPVDADGSTDDYSSDSSDDSDSDDSMDDDMDFGDEEDTDDSEESGEESDDSEEDDFDVEF